ncbi:MAG: endonuclease III [Alphaproteobacteria bacterium]|nr:endonuclease III [Alphaproteobacteria bacterium]
MPDLMTDAQRNRFWQALQAAYPQPACELIFSNPWELMMAIILSAQTTDKQVNRITPALFREASTPDQTLAIGMERVRALVKSVNYFNNKTRAIFNLAQVVADRFGGQIPADFDTLITLPGIGRKTASVFLNVAYHAPFIGVDTHVFRLCHRLKICVGKKPEDIERQLYRLVPKDYQADVALSLVLLGRYICKAAKPLCAQCPVYGACVADIKADIKKDKP